MGRLSLGQNSSSFAEPPVRFHACRRCAESRNVNDVVIYLHFVQTVLTDVRSRSSRPNRHRADNRSVTLTIKKHPPKGGCLFYGAESRKVKRLAPVLSLKGPSRWDVSHSDKIRPRSPNRRFASTPIGVVRKAGM